MIGGTRVERIVRLDGGGFDLSTPQGTTRARDVLVATNGYTDGLLPWLQRRLIPFDAYMIATEPLSSALMNRLLPTDRTYIDHVFDVVSIRRSPDGTRILFLWRTGTRQTGARAKGAQLLQDLARIVPEAAGLKLTHSWTGRCALTRDLWPHVATHDGNVSRKLVIATIATGLFVVIEAVIGFRSNSLALVGDSLHNFTDALALLLALAAV